MRSFIPPSSVAVLVALIVTAMVAFRIIGIEAHEKQDKDTASSAQSTVSEVPANPAGQATSYSVTRRDDVTSVREEFRKVLASESSSNAATSERTPPASDNHEGTGATSDVGSDSGSASREAKPSSNTATLSDTPPASVDTRTGVTSDVRVDSGAPRGDAHTAAGRAGQPRLWLPAAMLEPDKSIAITTELQVAEWERLQEDFVQAVNGRAPGSESEREAWIRAQQKNDELFRLKFGWDAFNAQQLKAYREGLAPSQP